LSIIAGARIVWTSSLEEGVVLSIVNDRVEVRFESDGRIQTFSISSGALDRVQFGVGEQVVDVTSGLNGVIVEEVHGQPEPTWRVAFPGGVRNVSEASIMHGGGDDPLSKVNNGDLDSAYDFNIRAVTEDLWVRHRYDPFASLDHARVDLKAHQVSVLHRVSETYPHRFLLCDEVGLGKTIEAAMIVKELRARGQAKRILIIVPPNLLRQWQFELKTKFNETFAIFTSATMKAAREQGDVDPWAQYDSVIVSQTWASYSEDRRREIASIDWDLIIVDEAHHAREQRNGNRVTRTNLYRLVDELTSRPEYARRAVLFLTATPLQLQRHELFSLVEMLRPTLFSSEDDFETHLDSLSDLNEVVSALEQNELEDVHILVAADYLGVDATEAQRVLSDRDDALKRLKNMHRLSEVLIRNRRAVIGGFQPRSAFRWNVTPTDAERELHVELEDLVSDGLETASRRRQNSLGFLMVLWQKLGASSTAALDASIRKRITKLRGIESGSRPVSGVDGDPEDALDDDVLASDIVTRVNETDTMEIRRLETLSQLIESIDEDSKAKQLRDHLREIFESDRDEKVIIFTEFRDTQVMLKGLIEAEGWSCHLFHGQLSPIEKERSVDDFRLMSGSQVLVSTEAGGEGRNFQFAHLLVNYDLPWNPMKVEQRIGRVDRIGQEHPIMVFNFAVEGTIEERVLDVLQNRIRIFEESVGGLDPILGETEHDIREAMRLTKESRKKALDQVAENTGRKVEEARRAEQQLRDLILDDRSYSAELARIAHEREQTVTQEQFETFAVALMRKHNTWVEDPDGRGERQVMFHPPFTTRHPSLFFRAEDGRRRVMFDPRVETDSDLVEYLGFGHPVMDCLVDDTLSDNAFGRAAKRVVPGGPLSLYRPGWQFNFRLRINGLRANEEILPLFVGDDGSIEPGLGELLMQKSRSFDREESIDSEVPGNLDRCHGLAEEWIGRYRQQMVEEARRTATELEDVERDRIERLAEHQRRAAEDRVTSLQTTLARMESSGRDEDRQILPAWRGRIRQAEQEIPLIEQERIGRLRELSDGRMLNAEYSLVGLARIEVA
jgi:ATP-dependent helicase HepA